MREDILVSVIIPVYNNERYVFECISSVINQTYSNIEILIINDGSTDDTFSVVKKINDDRIKLFCQDNQGVSNSRNLGLKYAKGEYITFVDGDDYISNTFIERALNYCIENKLDIVLGGTQKFNKTSKKNYCIASSSIKTYEKNKLKKIKDKIVGYISDDLLELKDCFMSGSVCKLFLYDKIKGVKFDEKLSIGEDTVFNIETMNKIRRIGIVPEIWYFYRMNDESATRKYNINLNNDTKNLLNKIGEIYVDETNITYFNTRAVLQFTDIIQNNIFHKNDKSSFFEKRKRIKVILNDEYWDKFFKGLSLKKIKGTKNALLATVSKFHCYNILLIISSVIKNKRKR